MNIYEHELAAVSEGICPRHLTPLDPDDRWCLQCRAWWTLDGFIVVQEFPPHDPPSCRACQRRRTG